MKRFAVADNPSAVHARHGSPLIRTVVDDNVIEEVCEDVFLNDVPAVHVLANFGIDFVPRAADAGVEEATKRTEVIR